MGYTLIEAVFVVCSVRMLVGWQKVPDGLRSIPYRSNTCRMLVIVPAALHVHVSTKLSHRLIRLFLKCLRARLLFAFFGSGTT